MPQDLLEFALAEVLRRLPDADLRPGSHLRTLVEAAVRSGQPINLPSQPRRLVNGGQYNPPYIPLQVTTFDDLMGRHPYRTPATGAQELPPPRRRGTMRETFERLYRGVFQQEQELMEYPAAGQTFTRQPLQPPSRYEQQLAEQVRAEEDRAIFAALDAATAERAGSGLTITNQMADGAAPPFTQQDLNDLFRGPLLPQPMTAPSPESWTVEELPGRMAINPAALRVMMPTFELASNPTINLEEVRARRFDVLEPAAITQMPAQEELWRRAFLGTNPFAEPGLFPAQLGMLSAQEFGATQNPCGEIPLAPREMTRAEMEEIALIVRRSAWERLLKDPDY